MQRAVLIGLFLGFIIISYGVPGLATDAVWSISQAFAFLRGEFFSDQASGFYFPSLGSILVAFWLKIFGITESALKIWYILIRCVSFLMLLRILHQKNKNSFMSVVFCALLIFDPTLHPDRTELVALLVWASGTLLLPENKYKIYIMSMLLWMTHPVAGGAYGIMQVRNLKQWPVLFLPGAILSLFLASTMSIWLQTIFVRLQPESIVTQLSGIKYIWPFQLLGLYVLYRSGGMLSYIKRALLLFIFLVLAGKPYYFFWMQWALWHEWAAVTGLDFKRPLRGSYIFLVSCYVYVVSVFPLLESRYLNAGYAEKYHQSLEFRGKIQRPDFVIPELAVPLWPHLPPVRWVAPEGIVSKLHRSDQGASALASQYIYTSDSVEVCIPPFSYVYYHLWLMPADTVQKGLFIYRARIQ